MVTPRDLMRWHEIECLSRGIPHLGLEDGVCVGECYGVGLASYHEDFAVWEDHGVGERARVVQGW